MKARSEWGGGMEARSGVEGVYIPKPEEAVTLEQFKPISLLDVDGKILMGVFAAWLSDVRVRYMLL